MSRISQAEFLKRFKISRTVEDGSNFYVKNYGRDLLHRRDVYIFCYTLLAEEECLDAVNTAVDMYEEGLSVDLLGYCILKGGLSAALAQEGRFQSATKVSKTRAKTQYRSEEKFYELLLIYNHCPTLEELVYAREQTSDSLLLRLLSLREIIYIFLRVAKMISYLESHEMYHGNIDESRLYVDQDGQLKMLLLPLDDSNLIRLVKYNQNLDLTASPELLAPELMNAFKGQSAKDFDLSPRMYRQADLFSLGLMCVRLISPKAFCQGYSLENMDIDVARLLVLIDTLGIFVDNSFAGILKQCLSWDASFRPEPFFLIEEIKSVHPHSIPNSLQGLSTREYQYDDPDPEYYTPKPESRSSMTSTGPRKSQYMTVEEPLERKKPLSRQMMGLHGFKSQDSQEKLPFDPNSTPLDRLRSSCLHFLESKIFDCLPHRHLASGKTGQVKKMRDGVNIGVLLYPNGDTYFGYVQNGKPNDLGLFLMASHEVYFGEFREGKISGRGCTILADNMCLDGDWLDNVIDGNAVVSDGEKSYWCIFNKGELIAKNEVDRNTLGPDRHFKTSLQDFYYKDFKDTSVVREIYEDYILGVKSGEDGHDPANYGRRPIGRTHKYRRMYDDYLGTNPEATKDDEARYGKGEDGKQSSRENSKSKIASSVKTPMSGSNSKRKQTEISRSKSKNSLGSSINHPTIDFYAEELPKSRYINSNAKERNYENLGHGKLRGPTFGDVKDLLNHPNREFTIPKYYDDVKDIEPRDRQGILADIDRSVVHRDTHSPLRYYSPPRHNNDDGLPYRPLGGVPLEDFSLEQSGSFIDAGRLSPGALSGGKPTKLALTSPRGRVRVNVSYTDKDSLENNSFEGSHIESNFQKPKASKDSVAGKPRSKSKVKKTGKSKSKEKLRGKSREKSKEKSKEKTKEKSKEKIRRKSKERSKEKSKEKPSGTKATGKKKLGKSKSPSKIGLKEPSIDAKESLGGGSKASRSASKDSKDSKVSKDSKGKKMKPKIPSVGYDNLIAIPKALIITEPSANFTGYGWTYYTTGEKFYGYFTQGVPNGIGTFYTFKDKQRNGRWKDGVYN